MEKELLLLWINYVRYDGEYIKGMISIWGLTINSLQNKFKIQKVAHYFLGDLK